MDNEHHGGGDKHGRIRRFCFSLGTVEIPNLEKDGRCGNPKERKGERSVFF